MSFGYADGGLTGVFEVPAKTAPGVMPRTTFKESVLLGYMFRSPFEGEDGGGAQAPRRRSPRCRCLRSPLPSCSWSTSMLRTAVARRARCC